MEQINLQIRLKNKLQVKYIISVGNGIRHYQITSQKQISKPKNLRKIKSSEGYKNWV